MKTKQNICKKKKNVKLQWRCENKLFDRIEACADRNNCSPGAFLEKIIYTVHRIWRIKGWTPVEESDFKVRGNKRDKVTCYLRLPAETHLIWKTMADALEISMAEFLRLAVEICCGDHDALYYADKLDLSGFPPLRGVAFDPLVPGRIHRKTWKKKIRLRLRI